MIVSGISFKNMNLEFQQRIRIFFKFLTQFCNLQKCRESKMLFPFSKFSFSVLKIMYHLNFADIRTDTAFSDVTFKFFISRTLLPYATLRSVKCYN